VITIWRISAEISVISIPIAILCINLVRTYALSRRMTASGRNRRVGQALWLSERKASGQVDRLDSILSCPSTLFSKPIN
jgi:hypothetical protein